MNNNLSRRQQEILAYIQQYVKENDYSPTYRDIQEGISCKSTSTVHKEVHKLIELGLLSMDAGNNRSLRPVISAPVEREDVFDIPVYGKVAAGSPIYADEYVEEYIPLPGQFFPRNSDKYFVLTVSGESMIEAGIFDGDHLLIRNTDYAQNGDQVVALIEEEATVKTYFRRNGYIELRPENSAMESILVENCRILGVVCGLYRLY